MAEVYYFWFIRVGLLPRCFKSVDIYYLYLDQCTLSLNILVFVVCFGGSIKIKSGHALL